MKQLFAFGVVLTLVLAVGPAAAGEGHGKQTNNAQAPTPSRGPEAGKGKNGFVSAPGVRESGKSQSRGAEPRESRSGQTSGFLKPFRLPHHCR
jgi:hypothetical protein